MRTRVGTLRDRDPYRGMSPTGTEGRFGFALDGEVEMVALGALDRPTRILLMHRGYADGVVVRLDDEGALYTSGAEVLVDRHEDLGTGKVLSSHVVDYSVGMTGIDGVIVRFVGVPAVAYLPSEEMFSEWFPDATHARGIARDASLDLFGACLDVVVMSHAGERCMVGVER